jgi:tRNA (cmo5U34)-methyltransferase
LQFLGLYLQPSFNYTMNEFDLRASEWDQDPMHVDRSTSVAYGIRDIIPHTRDMTALEYGSGTGITSYFLKDHFKEITMMDNSPVMVQVMNKNIRRSSIPNLKAVLFDLEKNQWEGSKFDIIITQMVLHHISDYKSILRKFSTMLNPEGYIAIADLYNEDGSFHGGGFNGHKGFDVEILSSEIRTMGYNIISANKCFSINKEILETGTKRFDLFLLIARKINK